MCAPTLSSLGIAPGQVGASDSVSAPDPTRLPPVSPSWHGWVSCTMRRVPFLRKARPPSQTHPGLAEILGNPCPTSVFLPALLYEGRTLRALAFPAAQSLWSVLLS